MSEKKIRTSIESIRKDKSYCEETIKRLAQNTNSIDISESDNITYNEFLQFFKGKSELNWHDIVIGISFTYSWMPRMINFFPKQSFNESNKEEIVEIINKARRANEISENNLTVLKSCFDNSLVGVSKLLHFINPFYFAIWDSRVLRYLEVQPSLIANPKSYLEYLQLLCEITQLESFLEIKIAVDKVLNYNVSPYRAAELVMYLNGQPQNLK